MNKLIELQNTGIKLIDGDRGENYPLKKDFYDKEYCLFLNAGNITAKGFDFSSTQFITQQKDRSLHNGKLERNDIVMTTRGSVGNVALYDESVPFENIRINSGMIIIRCGDKYSPQLLYYLLQSPFVKKQIDDMTSGSVQKQLPVSIINRVKIIKDYISMNVGIIHDLDRKIKNNNQINTQLEELAKTIYDYWFLQFEFPNEEGKPYKSSGGKMVYNEQLKREIPEGWKTRTLNSSNLFTIIKQGVDYFSKKNYLATANVIDNNILDGNLISYENREGRANMQPRLNSVWFAKMKNSRKHIFISQSDQWMVDKYIISTGFTGLQCNTITFPYVYSYINSDYFEKVKDYRASGSTQEGIGDDDLILFSIVEPIEQTLVSYSKLVGCLIEKMNILRLENQYLSSLRDFLLPILMNGQVTFKGENEGLESENNKSATISYIERFNQWKQMQGYAARGDVDDEILMKIFDAMDEDDKK